MAHQVETYAGGTRARVVVDLNAASLDSDALPIGSDWQTLTNVLNDLPGVLRKRGAITEAGANSTDINDASGALAFYDGPLRSGTTYRPYIGFCVDTGTSEYYLQHEASSRSQLLSSAIIDAPYPTSRLPTAGEAVVIVGRSADNTTYPNRAGSAIIYFGGNATDYSTGTVTLTTGSASVTGSGTSWTSSMEGKAFRCPTDTSGLARYRVKKVASSTSLILDRAYAGSATGASLAYFIEKQAGYACPSASPWGSSNGRIVATAAASAWSRVVVASTREPGSSGTLGDATPEYPQRVRWSGVIGSDDGSGAVIGMFAWHNDGYIDLDSKHGAILALAPLGDALLAFQESGLTVLRGAPVYDGAGSLDASETHRNVFINGGFAYESTPEGVFFFDKQRGPCVYDGTRIARLGDKRVARTMQPYGITSVGYYDGKVVFSGTTTKGLFVFDTANGSWAFHNPPTIISHLQAGRIESDEDLVGLAAGVQVVNVTNLFDSPGVAAADWDSTAITATVKTGKIGDPMTYLRPERAFITYRLTDLSTTNPYLTLTVTTGLPDTSDSAHTHTSVSTELAETTNVETVELELNIDRDPMIQVQLAQSNAAGKLELFSVVLDCAVEGVGESS